MRAPVRFVVVGVDGGPSALAAVDARRPAASVLNFAFREARLHDAELRLLFGWNPADGEVLPAGERQAERVAVG